ncbi:PAS domain S-box protein [Bacillus sp. FJAT-42376]|uniref:ATP-binding protein n=1 Tax=Bacillus sp. FJAT-42376 TaxID=2014076 RepID=UPI000F507539|nr:ATP-binding protein [Bacillus sp. FJAT-42376]AZB44257.1 PAS domain S-box protein [Bacillus sp. FJAT-42376]
MYFTLLAIIAIIPFVLGVVILFHNRTPLFAVAVSFLLLLGIWQFDLSILYGVGLFPPETAQRYFSLFRCGLIFTFPVVCYLLYILLTRYSKIHFLSGKYSVWVLRLLVTFSLLVSIAAYAVSNTELGIKGLEIYRMGRHFPIHYYPVFGDGQWLFLLNTSFTLVMAFILIFVSLFLTVKEHRLFSFYLSITIFTVISIGLLSGYKILPLFISGFSSVLLSLLIFIGVIQNLNRGLKEQKNLLHTIMNLNPNYIYVKNEDHQFIIVNDAMASLYNTEAEGILYKTDLELNPRSVQAVKIEMEEKKVLLGIKPRYEKLEKIVDLKGETRWIEVLKIPVKLLGKQLILCIGTDISQRKRDEELILKAEKMSVVGELAAGVAHEIRNPLTSLKGFVQFLGEDDHSKHKNHLRVMAEEIDRINEVIDELLLIAKPQGKSFKEEKAAEILEDVILLMEESAKASYVQFMVQADPEMSIMCNKNHLKQVFMNLIKNSIEAMEFGGTMSIDCFMTGDGAAQFVLKDEGSGIEPERIEKLGEPFFTTKERGTGLGLTVCYKIVKEEHRGSIQFESELGKGTTVTIRLPLDPIEEAKKRFR